MNRVRVEITLDQAYKIFGKFQYDSRKTFHMFLESEGLPITAFSLENKFAGIVDVQYHYYLVIEVVDDKE